MKNKKIISNLLKSSIPKIFDFFLLRKKIFLLILLLFILISATAFRLYQLDQIPSGLSEEEANFGLLSIEQVGKGSVGFNSFLQNIPNINIFVSLISISFKIFGINLFGLRVLSSLIGILTIVGFFLLLKKLHFSLGLSLLGTFFISFSFWHINLSRLAYVEVFIPFFIIWFSFFLLCGIFSKKYFYFVLSGAMLGLGIVTLPLMLFSLIIPLLFVSFLAFLDKTLLRDLKIHLSIFALSILFFSTPLFIQIYNNPSIFRESFRQSLNFAGLHPSFAKNILTYFGSLFYKGDSSQFHNQLSFPAIPLAWSILFIFGFFLSIKNIALSIYGQRKNISIAKNIHSSILAQAIFFVALLMGGLNSDQNPDFKQFSWAIPAVFIFCIIPFEYLLEVYQKLKLSTRISMKKWRWNIMQLSMLILLSAIILAGFSQIYLYFQAWAKDTKTAQAFQQKPVSFGKTIKSIMRKENNFIIIPKNTDTLEDTDIKNLKSVEFSGFPEIKNYIFIYSDEDLSEAYCKNSLIVFYDSSDLLRKKFQKKCPENTFKKQSSLNGGEDFWTMQ